MVTTIDVAIVFADVRGSSELGERHRPSDFAAILNRFYRAATESLVRHNALIDKLIGDEVMALFVPGVAGHDYRRSATDAGLDLLRTVGYGTGEEPWLPLGVGVHAGTAYVGNAGSSGVNDVTALGQPVNVAARLQTLAAAGEVVISAENRPGLGRRSQTCRVARSSTSSCGHDPAVVDQGPSSDPGGTWDP